MFNPQTTTDKSGQQHTEQPVIKQSQQGLTLGRNNIYNDYVSTEKTQSGIYAGTGGLDVNVGGTTHLTGGVIESAAEDVAKNQITTGKLIAESIKNHSKWTGLDMNANETVKGHESIAGVASSDKSNVPMPGNVLSHDGAGTPGIAGHTTLHNEHSTTVSAIGSNIALHAGSVEGDVSRDTASANGHLDNKFNATDIKNKYKKQDEISKIINAVSGKIIDQVVPADPADGLFASHKDKGGNVSANASAGNAGASSNSSGLSNHDIANMVVGGVSAIGSAALGGGDVGATVAGVAAGDAAGLLLPNVGDMVANAIDPKPDHNPKDPNYKHDTNVSGNASNVVGAMVPDKQQQSTGNKVTDNKTYDTETDIHKLISSFTNGLITGGAGAAAGIAAGNDPSIDAVTGAFTSQKQHTLPKKPKAKDKNQNKNNSDNQKK